VNLIFGEVIENTNPWSISGSETLPRFYHRRTAGDMRGEVEYRVVELWSGINSRPVGSRRRLPIHDVCPSVKEGKESIFDSRALMSINTTVQWLFGTNQGYAVHRSISDALDGVHDPNAARQIIADTWKKENVRAMHINGGRVPLDHLCMTRRTHAGRVEHEPICVRAILLLLLYLFVTEKGKKIAAQLHAVEGKVFKKRRTQK